MRNLFLIGSLIFFNALTLNAQMGDIEKANKQFELHAYNLAIKSYTAILDDNKSNYPAMVKLADCYYFTNNMAAAAEWYQKAIANDLITGNSYFNYVETLMAINKYAEAKRLLLNYTGEDTKTAKALGESCDFALQKKNLPPLFQVYEAKINSSASDFGAIFLDKNLLYSSSRTDFDKTIGDGFNVVTNKLFVAPMDNANTTGAPALFKNILNNGKIESNLSYSTNGKWVAFAKNNFLEGTRQIPAAGNEMSIFIAEADSKGDWTEARAFMYNGNGFSNGYPYLSPDGNTLYFTSNRAGGQGGFDIYSSNRDGEKWLEPTNLGTLINTPGDEIAPLYIDGVLYFASDYHMGFGGMDNFKAEMKNGSWDKVINLGPNVNSGYDDYGFSYDAAKNLGCFTSNRIGGKGQEDIYFVKKEKNQYTIRVVNAANREPLENAHIEMTECTGINSAYTNASGNSVIELPPIFDCKVKVSRGGYRTHIFPMSNNADREIVIQLRAQENEYIGKLIDQTTRQPLMRVFVKSTEQASGNVEETASEEAGKYGLTMLPGKVYVIKYSKAGYSDVTKIIDNKDGVDKTILGTIKMIPSQTNLESAIAKVENEEAEQTPKKQKKPAKAERKTTSVNKETPAKDVVASKPEKAKSTEKIEGFSVQLASAKDGKIELEKFGNLAAIGNIYHKYEGDVSKIRLGIFPTRDAAQTALDKVKDKGYASAFIVNENITSEDSIIRALNKKESAVATKSEVQPAVSESEKKVNGLPKKPTPTPVSVTEYKIRIATLKSTVNLQREALKKIATIEEVNKDGNIIVLLKGFTSLQAAQNVLPELVKLGYKDAFIVIEEKGVLKKVN